MVAFSLFVDRVKALQKLLIIRVVFRNYIGEIIRSVKEKANAILHRIYGNGEKTDVSYYEWLFRRYVLYVSFVVFAKNKDISLMTVAADTPFKSACKAFNLLVTFANLTILFHAPIPYIFDFNFSD